jgi:hypothetical protein
VFIDVLSVLKPFRHSDVHCTRNLQELAATLCAETSAHGKGKADPVTGRGGPSGCETSSLPHFLDNWLTDGGEVSLTRPPAALYLREDSKTLN